MTEAAATRTRSAPSGWLLLAFWAAWFCMSAGLTWLVIGGAVWRTHSIIGVATRNSARRSHISMTAVSSGVRPNRLGSG